MATSLRLTRMGTKKRPFYRIVVADSRVARNGRVIESVGYYNPLPDPAVVKVDEEKVKAWLRRGAVPTDTVRSLLRREGLWQRLETEAGEAISPAEVIETEVEEELSIEEATVLALAKEAEEDEERGSEP